MHLMFGFVSPYILSQPLNSGSYGICSFPGKGRLHVCVAGYHLSRNSLPPPSYSHRNVGTLDFCTKQPDFTWILRTSTQILRLVKEVDFGQFASNLSHYLVASFGRCRDTGESFMSSWDPWVLALSGLTHVLWSWDLFVSLALILAYSLVFKYFSFIDKVKWAFPTQPLAGSALATSRTENKHLSFHCTWPSLRSPLMAPRNQWRQSRHDNIQFTLICLKNKAKYGDLKYSFKISVMHLNLEISSKCRVWKWYLIWHE